MTDIEEREKAEEDSHKRSIRGSIFNSPKDFPIINPSGKINDSSMSILSQTNLALFDNLQSVK